MIKVTYYKSKGLWHKRLYKNQCEKIVNGRGKECQCQGIENHEGIHWRYSSSGGLYIRDDKSEFITMGAIPPDDVQYVHPKEMQSKYHINNFDDSIVTDEQEIAKMENYLHVNGFAHSYSFDKEL